MGDKLKGALIGGLAAGVLSVIPFVSSCSCLWAIGGGLLAGYLYIKSSPEPVTMSVGATVGALAGVLGTEILFVFRMLLSLAFGMAGGLDAQFRRAGVQLPFSGVVLVLIAKIIGAILTIVFATVGGLIAVPIFEKRKGAAEPPPPPAFGA